MTSQPELTTRPRIDSFLVADWAEALNGKIYLMGGGFDTLFTSQFPFSARFSFAALLRVPWADTNRRFPVEATIETIDGEALGWEMQGELEAGRAPGTRAQDVSIAIAGPIQFQAEGPVDFVVKLRFASDERALPLRVVQAPYQVMPTQPDRP